MRGSYVLQFVSRVCSLAMQQSAPSNGVYTLLANNLGFRNLITKRLRSKTVTVASYDIRPH